MRKTALFLCFALLLSFASALPSAAAQLSANPVAFTAGEETLILNENAADILNNGGMEHMNEGAVCGWGVTCNQSIGGVQQNFIGSDIVFRNSENAHSGTYSMQITNPAAVNGAGTTSSTFLRQQVGITPGVTYELSVWVKSLDTQSGNAFLRGTFMNAAGETAPFKIMTVTLQNPGPDPSVTLPSGEWVKKGIRFTAPEGAEQLFVYLYLNGQGSVLYDDAVLLVPKENAPAVSGSDAKKAPALTENSPQFGNVYAIAPGNGDFESYEAGHFIHKQGSPGGHNAVVSDAYNHTENGSKSLYMENYINSEHGDFRPNLYYNRVSLVPGAKYQISTWILAPEAGTAADFCYTMIMTKSDGTTDQKKRHLGVKTYGWWREFIFEFEVPSDSENVTTTVVLTSMNDTMRFYIDDVTLYMVERPPHANIETDEMFYYTEWERGTVSADAFPSYVSALEGGRADFAFLDKDGETVLASSSVPYENGKADYEFSLDLMEDKGEAYFVTAEIYNASGEFLQEGRETVYRYDRPTYMGADGVFRKNGKEYNIVNGSGVTTELLEADPRLGGVTVVRLVSDGTTLLSKMDKAHEMGLLCLIGLYGTQNGGHESMIENTVQMVNTYKDHPALFGYHVQDEPYQKGNSEEDLARAYKTIRDLDPNHVVYLDDSVEGGYSYLFRYADYVDIDYYGGADAESGKIFKQKMTAAYKASKGRKPFGLMQQAFRNNGYLPTADELRNFAYQSFFAGATGLSYHSLGLDGTDGENSVYMDSPEWDELCEKWAPFEQGFLFDAFVNDKYEALSAFTDDAADYRTFKDGDVLYAVVYNRKKTESSEVIIPFCDNNGVRHIARYSAEKLAGSGAGEETKYGTDELRLTLSPLAAEIWKITPTDNLIPNGSFENAFTEYSFSAQDGTHKANVPSSEWQFADNWRPTVQGNAYRVSNSEFANPFSSGFSLKIAKEKTGSNGNASGSHVVLPFDNTLLDKNDIYKLEYYYNVPEDLTGTNVYFQGGLWGAERSTPISAYQGSTVSVSTKTDGWQKVTFEFTYNGAQAGFLRFGFRYDAANTENATGTAVAYVDGVKLTKIADRNPEDLLKADGTFERISDITTSDFRQHGSAEKGVNYDIVSDPENAENKVLKQISGTNPNRSVIKIPLSNNQLSTDSLVKVSLRFYVEAAEVPEENFSVPFRYRMASKTRSASVIDANAVITPEMFNTWVEYEALITPLGTNATSHHEFVLLNNAAGFAVYLDDIEAVPVTASSVINMASSRTGDKKALNDTNDGGYGLDAFESQAWGCVKSAGSAVSVNDTVYPSAVFVPETSGDAAYAFIALYKVEGEEMTLVKIVSETLSATAAGIPVFSSRDAFFLNLAEEELDDGAEYIVETCLWNAAGLSPVVSPLRISVSAD